MSNFTYSFVHYTIAANDPIEDESIHDPSLNFFGIYDGHGGVLCSDFLRRTLHHILRDQFHKPEFAPLPIEQKLKNAFAQVDDAFIGQLAQKRGNCMENCAGSCCLVALLEEDTVYVANAGDSRAILVSRSTNNNTSYTITPLSFDHNANSSESERKLVAARSSDPNPVRLSDALKDLKEMQPEGVTLDESDFPLRVAGTLMVTRAIGDAYLKRSEYSYPPYQDYTPYITSEPEVISHQIKPEDDFIVMASDGLWEILSNEEVVEFILEFRRRGLPGNVGQLLVHKMLERRAEQLQFPIGVLRHLSPVVRRSVHDDVSLFIIFFNNSSSSSPSSPSSDMASTQVSPPESPLSSHASSSLLNEPEAASRTSGSAGTQDEPAVVEGATNPPAQEMQSEPQPTTEAR